MFLYAFTSSWSKEAFFSRERLNGVFAEVITVDVLDSRDEAHLALLQRPELGITFTKIHCWSLTQYEKCVFLDADTLVGSYSLLDMDINVLTFHVDLSFGF